MKMGILSYGRKRKTLIHPKASVYQRLSMLLCVLLFHAILFSLLPFCAREASAQVRSAHVSYQASVGGCPLFPADNIWNQDISALPVAANSASYISSMGIGARMHPDFGSGLYNGSPIGIPYIVVPAQQATVPIQFEYAGESDPGPYPIPANAPIEGGAQGSGDRHVLIVQSGTCKLYETFSSYPNGSGWRAGSGAVWNLTSNALRPQGWTSADAAGLPILPGLARYDEVATGAILHALRFTASQTQKAYIWPARHYASSRTDPALPPMGLRVRLKASVDIRSFPPQARVVLTALKRYGMILADNGSNWFVSGSPDDRWNNDDLASLHGITGAQFEVVDTQTLQAQADSAQSLAATVQPTPTAKPTSKPTPKPTPTTPPKRHPVDVPKLPTATTDDKEHTSTGSAQASASGGISPLTLGALAIGGVAAILGAGYVFVSRKRKKRE